MPSRVIRADFNDSQSMAAVSEFAELTFVKLLLAADDFGRMDARLPFLQARLFPMRAKATQKRVQAAIEELAQDGCVQLYIVDGRPFLRLVNWEKHRSNSKRAAGSKYPEPDDPRDSPGSPRIPVNPRPSGRVTGDEGRVTSDVEDPPDPHKSPGAETLFPEGGLNLEQKQTLAAYETLKHITPSQFAHACEVVMCWSHTKNQRRKDWPLVIRGAIVRGWGLDGYGSGRGNGHDKPEARARRNSADVEALLRGPQASQDRAGATQPENASTRTEGGANAH